MKKNFSSLYVFLILCILLSFFPTPERFLCFTDKSIRDFQVKCWIYYKDARDIYLCSYLCRLKLNVKAHSFKQWFKRYWRKSCCWYFFHETCQGLNDLSRKSQFFNLIVKCWKKKNFLYKILVKSQTLITNWFKENLFRKQKCN